MLDFSIEKSVNIPLVAGVDEAGRGPLAGPVVAAAVMFPDFDFSMPFLKSINDSKKLSKNMREKLFIDIKNYAKIGIGIADENEIDSLNILRATFLAMERAVSSLEIPPGMVIVDGNHVPPYFKGNGKAVIKGDAKSLSIAAASIIAKVTRDGIMEKLGKDFPMYNWQSNQGYGVAEHLDAMKKHGVCRHHRKSFSPVRSIIENPQMTLGL